ncbi:MAG: hypothetical protein Q7U94_04945 [Sideroxyarcus sp.]|nr:hypothetical protein [Sideroxyarcus sp.]
MSKYEGGYAGLTLGLWLRQQMNIQQEHMENIRITLQMPKRQERFSWPLKSEGKMKSIHSRSFKTIAQITRWSIAGIFLVIFALPAIATFNS